MKVPMSTYSEILDRTQTLTPDEQKRLLEDLANIFHQQVTIDAEKSSQKLPRKNLGRWRGFFA